MNCYIVFNIHIMANTFMKYRQKEEYIPLLQ